MKKNLTTCFAALSALLLGMPASLTSGGMGDKANPQTRAIIAGQKGNALTPRLDPNSGTGGADLVMKGGTWLSLTSGVTLSLGGNLLNQGVIAPSVGSTVIFNGRGPQAETGFALFPDLMKTGGGMLTLNNPVAISGTLILVNGDISLSGFTLPVNSLSGGSASSYIVTPDTSSGLVRPVGSLAPVLFPVGNTSYNPVSLRTGTGTDLFRVSVVDSLMPVAPNKETALKRTWLIFQNNPPGVNGNIVFSVQWNSGEEGSLFDRSLGGTGSADGWRWTGTTWARQTNSRFFDNGLTVYPAIDSIVATTMGPWTLANESGALPIQLASFTATIVAGRFVRLDWTTLSEINNYGFEVQRKRGSDSTFHSLPDSFVPGHGTTNELHTYSFTDTSVSSGQWWYRLKQMDLDGSIHYGPQVTVGVLAAVGENPLPVRFTLHQNYPNPFNPSTTIRFDVPTATHVSLKLYNVLGQVMMTVLDGVEEPGYKSVVLSASNLASGMYFYQLRAEGFVETRRMVVMK